MTSVPRSRGRRTGVPEWLALWAALSGVAPAAAAGQTSGGTGSTDPVELVVASERPWTPAVAVVLSFAGGYDTDPPGGEGRAWLLGMSLERTARARLAETGAIPDIEVGDARTWVTLLAASTDWTTAYRTLVRVLLEDPLDPDLVGEARADLSRQVFFQRGASVRAFQLEARRVLLGRERIRPPMGTPSSVNGATIEALEAARARIYRMDRARVALVGPLVPADAVSAVGGHRTLASHAGGAWIVEGEPLPARGAGWAWKEGGRHTIAADITNGWVQIAYPFSGAAARGPMEFVAHVMRAELDAVSPAPGLISRRIEIRELPAGPVLLVTIAAEWPTALVWEQRVADMARRLAARPLSLDSLNRRRRSFRSVLALERADPGREGRRLLVEAGAGSGERRAPLRGLSPEDVRRAVAALGEPRVLVYGPLAPPP